MSNFGMRRGFAPVDPRWSQQELRERESARRRLPDMADEAARLLDELREARTHLGEGSIDRPSVADLAAHIETLYASWLPLRTEIVRLEYRYGIRAKQRRGLLR